MLTNAKEMRRNYIERVKEVADDIINVINCLEEQDCWEGEMGEDYSLDVLFYIEGDEYEADVDITEVYDYLTTVIDNGISPTKSVIEALEEVFEIECDPWRFVLVMKGYEIEEN